MRTFLLFTLFVQAAFGAEWNPEGETLYRRIRIDRVEHGEAEPEKRIRKEVVELLTELETEESAESFAKIKREIDSIERILTDENLRILYDIFLRALDNRKIKVPRAPDPADLESRETSELLTQNIIKLKGSGAGLYHLHLFEGYQLYIRKIPDFSPSNVADHFPYFDEYLKGKGIVGFMDQARNSTYDADYETREGAWADYLRNSRAARGAKRLSYICIAVIAGMALERWVLHPTSVNARLEGHQSVQMEKKDPEVLLDEAADSVAKKAAEAFYKTHPKPRAGGH